MSINEQERRAIAFLTTALRKSVHGATNFDEPGVLAALGRVRHLDIGNVTMAAMRCAADSSIKTPAMIGDPSSSVYAEKVGPERARRHPRREDACTTCGRGLTPNCCDNPTQRPAPSSDYTSHAQQARELLSRVEKRPPPEERPVTIDPRADAARAVLHPAGDGKGRA